KSCSGRIINSENGHDDIREVLSLKKRTFLRRAVMVLLFFGALYTTISTISNVTMNDIFMDYRQVTVDPMSKKSIQENKLKSSAAMLKIKDIPELLYLPTVHEQPPETVEKILERNFPKERV